MKIKLDPGAYLPTRAHPTDAGLDIRAMEAVEIAPRGMVNVHTGVHVQLPEGMGGLLVSKSGLMAINGITSTGLIDEGYTGEIVVTLINHNDYPYWVSQKEKISQLVVFPVIYEPVELVEEIIGGGRGDGGFGSTGRV